MKSLLVVAFIVAVIGFVTSMVVLLKMISKRKAQRLQY
jgi:hypothetical protein